MFLRSLSLSRLPRRFSLNKFAITLKLAEDSTPQYVVTEAKPIVDCCRNCWGEGHKQRHGQCANDRH